jgi:Xaa-Pro aminopeptidase
VNGKFTPPQRVIYDLLLSIQKQLIQSSTVGKSLDMLQAETFHAIRDALQSVFKRKLSGSEMNELYPHHVGHYIGLDVHDTPHMSRSLPLEENMAITIEPGIYIPDSDRYPREFRGIGMRIEDDVQITKLGPIVLTSEAPKEVVDIEALVSK